MSDLINRQDAIDVVAKWIYDVFGIKETDRAATIFKRLRAVPSAERENGRWIRGDAEKITGKARCSICGESCYKGERYFKICPNCGADMRGDE